MREPLRRELAARAFVTAGAILPYHRLLTFNTIFVTFMHETPPGKPEPTLVYCGDDPDAKEVAAGLIGDLGFEPVDVGGAEATPWIESLARIVITLAYQRGRGPFVYRFQER